MIRILIFSILIYVAYRILKFAVISLLKLRDQTPGDEVSPTDTELIQDPQCNTYFLRQQGIAGRVKGKTFYFCSQKCRDAYLRKHAPDL